MYMLPEPISQGTQMAMSMTNDSKFKETELWHRRLAHINMRDLVTLHRRADDVPHLQQSDDVCRACRLGKAHKLPFQGHFNRADIVGDILHSDIVGPLELSFPDKYKYVSTFLDDRSRYTPVGLMTRRKMQEHTFKQASAKFTEIGGDIKIRMVHSDGAKEYIALQNDIGGVNQNNSFSPPYTPELNRIAERVNRNMLEAALSMLIQANLPSCLWPFALKHAIHVRNRMPHSATEETPYLVMIEQKPSLKHIRVFGCAAYVLRQPSGSKFYMKYRCVEHAIPCCILV